VSLVLAVLVSAAAVQARADTLPMVRMEVAPAETVAVRDVGEGPPIIIVPGMLGSAYGFRQVVPGLVAAGHRVIVVDPLGTGASNAPEKADYSLTAQAERVGNVAAQLGVDRAVFVCHHIGGSICYRLALKDPALVAGILSLNGGPAERLSTPGLGLALKLAPLLKIFGGTGKARGKVRDGLKDSSVDPSWVTEEVVAGYTAHYTRGIGPVLGTLKRMSSAQEPDSLTPSLPALQPPVHLLLGAGRAGSMTADQFIAIHAVPRLAVDSVAGAGQYIQEERPDVVVAAAIEMANQADAERPWVVAARRTPIRTYRINVRSTSADTIR
jgi:pimeloyl-ACP methyl ester carboxylesterase